MALKFGSWAGYLCLAFTLMWGSLTWASFLPSAVNGNIGINSSSPRGRLDVDGGLYASSIWIDGYIYGDATHLTNLTAGMSGTLTSPRIPVASGASSLIDSAIYFTGGNAGIGSTAPRSALDVNGASSLKQVVLVPPATQTITAGGGLSTVGGAFIRIVSSGGAVTVSANPQIVTTGIADGQELLLMGTSDTDKVTFSNGNGLSLDHGISFTLGNGNKLKLIYSAADGVWSETARYVRN